MKAYTQNFLSNRLYRIMRHNLTLAIVLLVIIFALSVTAGCDTLRFAPSEAEQQNAYLHYRTVQAAALQAQLNDASQPVQDLTERATYQSEAILGYYGMPRELPPTDTIEVLLSQENQALTNQARVDALERPDPWDVADQLLELGIALAGVVGGVYGAKAVSALRLARDKSTALREVVAGNEFFKKRNAALADEFKQAQQQQSAVTRGLVANLK